MYTSEFMKNTLRVYPDGHYGTHRILKDGLFFGYIDEYKSVIKKMLKKANNGTYSLDFIKTKEISCCYFKEKVDYILNKLEEKNN